MDNHAARLALSPQTGLAATTTPRTPAQQAWYDFLSNPDTLTWVRNVICKRLGVRTRRPRASDESRLDDLVGDALLAMVEATGFRLGRSAQAYACDIIQKSLIDGMRYRQADIRDERRTVDMDEARFLAATDPWVDDRWEHDRAEDVRMASRLSTEAVQTVLATLTGDPRAWAEMYLTVERTADVPLDPAARVRYRRPDSIRETQRRLQWKRLRCDRARAQLHQALASVRPWSRT